MIINKIKIIKMTASIQANTKHKVNDWLIPLQARMAMTTVRPIDNDHQGTSK